MVSNLRGRCEAFLSVNQVHLGPRDMSRRRYHVGQIMLIARILAGDHWTTITIPRGASANFNYQVWGKGHYTLAEDQKEY